MKRTIFTEPYKITDLFQLVSSENERFGDKELYIYKEKKQEKRLTYREHYERCLYFGTMLCSMELAGKRIAVIGDTHPSYLTAFISTVSANGTIVPLDKDMADEAIVDFMNISEVSAVVYTESFNNRLINYKDKLRTCKYFFPIAGDSEKTDNESVIPFEDIILQGKELYEGGDRAFTEIKPELDRVAAIIFTSGTTGTSKGVMLSHKNIVTAVNCSNKAMTHLNKDDVLVDCLPMNHSYEITCGQLAAQNLGATIVINESIKSVLRNFAKYKPSALVLVPLFVETVYKKIWSEIDKRGMRKKVRALIGFSDFLLSLGIDLREKLFSQIREPLGGNLRHIVVGGAAMNPQIIKDFKSFGITILEGYGITECSPLVAVNRLGKEKLHSVGTPVYGCQVRIDKEANEETGEIVVKGDNVMLGYLNAPEATREVFTDDGWFKTGDIGYMDNDNYIYITGRKKNVIILSNGKNVFPEELEEHLLVKEDIISECVVIGRKNSSDETVITAVIYPNQELAIKNDKEKLLEAVRAAVNDVNKSLPIYKQIRDVEIRETEFEKTTTKKIKRFLVK